MTQTVTAVTPALDERGVTAVTPALDERGVLTVTHALDERGVLTVTLADDENRNALSRQLMAELTAVLDDADADPSVRVVVLTNSGRVFCSGADLRESAAASADAVEHPVTVRAKDVFARFRSSPKPYIGRIDGHCVAGGMGLAAAMDIAVARNDVKFGFTEVRVGVAPAMISVLCLPKMRRADAAMAFLRGNRFDADTAARLGLINAAVPAESLDAEVDAIIADLLAGAPSALSACKQLLVRVPEMGFDKALDWTESLSSELFASDDAAEGMSAFLNRRLPRWAPGADEVASSHAPPSKPENSEAVR